MNDHDGWSDEGQSGQAGARFYTVIGIVIASCLVLLVFWVIDRQVAVRVAPFEAAQQELRSAISGLSFSRQLQDESLNAIGKRVLVLETRPPQKVIIMEEARPTPVFSKGLVAK